MRREGKGGIYTNIIRPKDDLWYTKPLVVHHQHLAGIPRQAQALFRQGILAHDGVGHRAARLEVPGEVGGDVAAGFLDVVGDVCLVHHVPLAEGDELFEVVGEEFPADVEALEGGEVGGAAEEGDDVGEAETRVDDEGALGGGRGEEGGGGAAVVGGELVFLEDELVVYGLDVGEVVVGLGEEERGLGGVDAEGLGGEHAVPDGFLGVPVYDEALFTGVRSGSLGERTLSRGRRYVRDAWSVQRRSSWPK